VNPAESPLPEARALRALFLGPPRWTLAVAESLTCGRTQAAIGAVAGASDFFLGGITAYSIEQKVRHLGVDEKSALECDAVSAVVAAQMAAGTCLMFGSDFAISSTGYAEPNSSRSIAHPIAYWAVARTTEGRTPTIIREGCVERPGLSRIAMQMEVTREVLDALVSCLRELH